jgi:uncharacterized membrane protein
MLLTIQVIAVLMVAFAMSMATAHALELPGKLRLDEQSYMTVQTIYYPGFTIGGIGEPLAGIVILILLLLSRDQRTSFWWILVAFVAVVGMHIVFWFVTQPMNRYWLKHHKMGKAGARFFSVVQDDPTDPSIASHPDWKHYRNRWEYSHVARAILSAIVLTALVIAIAI